MPHYILGKHWSSLKHSAVIVGCSLMEAQKGEAEEAETVSAMASLSVDTEQGKADCTLRYAYSIGLETAVLECLDLSS